MAAPLAVSASRRSHLRGSALRRLAARAAIRAALCTALALLPGCGSRDNSTLSLAVITLPDDASQSGIDRHLARQLTRAATAEGLVAFDAQGRVVPALADRWIVTDDGQSYLFRLRDGEWRDGTPLTAASAKAALDRALRALRRTPLALDLATIEEIRVMAGRVIEIRLYRPMPNLLQLMAQPELGLLREKQGNGPMALERAGEISLFTPIDPARLGLPQVLNWDERTRQLAMTELSAEQAVDRFNEGAVELVLGGRIQDFPRTRSVGILRGTIQLDPALGLFGLHVARDEGFLSEPRNREALALAIDRAALIAPFGVDGWSPTTRLVANGLDDDLRTNGERWTDQSMEQRRAAAAERVREWRTAAGAQDAPSVSLWLPAGPGSDILFDRLASDFRAIGILSTRARSRDEADLRMIDEVARFPRARWFLNRLSCTARSGLCDTEVDTIVASAARIVDASQRAALLGEAEARLTQANLYIPFGPPIRWSLVRGNVAGFATNSWGWHPLMPLAWLPK